MRADGWHKCGKIAALINLAEFIYFGALRFEANKFKAFKVLIN